MFEVPFCEIKIIKIIENTSFQNFVLNSEKDHRWLYYPGKQADAWNWSGIIIKIDIGYKVIEKNLYRNYSFQKFDLVYGIKSLKTLLITITKFIKWIVSWKKVNENEFNLIKYNQKRKTILFYLFFSKHGM